MDCWFLSSPRSLDVRVAEEPTALDRSRTHVHLLGGGRRTEFPLGATRARVESSRVSATCYGCPFRDFVGLLVNFRVATDVVPRFHLIRRPGCIGCTQPQTLATLRLVDPSTTIQPLEPFPSARSRQAPVYSQPGYDWHHCRTAQPPKTSGSTPWLSGPQRLRGIWNPPASTALLGIAIGAGVNQVPVGGGSLLRLTTMATLLLRSTIGLAAYLSPKLCHRPRKAIFCPLRLDRSSGIIVMYGPELFLFSPLFLPPSWFLFPLC